MTAVNRASGCKINLLLNILGKRPDGFHELETVLQPVPLFDEIEFVRSGASIELTCDNPILPCDGSNLIVKAATAFFSRTGLSSGVKIHLRKSIPMEAGLGGGSGNAATTLLGLNELFGQPIADDELQQIAAGLGSDVPFFLQQNPAIASGRGEIIESLEPFRSLASCALILVHPGFGISTPWAYQTLAQFPDALHGRAGRGRQLIAKLQSGSESGDGWGGLLYNSLEAPAFAKYPVLNLYVDSLKEHGALGALMSGSGSTVFGYFSNAAKAEQALERFRTKFGTEFWSVILP